jgi:single-stranded-DNA-specific exonuclease
MRFILVFLHSMQKIILRRTSDKLIQYERPIHPLLQSIYSARGIQHEGELQYQLANLLKPNFKGLSDAVSLLADAVVAQAKIIIIGDFDADGATSSALGVLALRAMGLSSVDFLVPNRFEYGYGLTPEIVAVAAAQHPDMIITVDNGISSIEGVAAARELGITVIVTDHHLPGSELPDADAIVNPNQPGCEFPSKHLAGVGVIFYVMNALRAELRHMGWFDESGVAEPNMASFLDLVALGTVADVVPLDHNNRILVAQGLQRIRAGGARQGIKALLDVAGKQASDIVANDFGFALGPRLNAAGRLDDMSLGIQCLMCESESLAREMALQMDELNRDRKSIESGMQQEAMSMLQRVLSADIDSLPWGVCLFDETWHQGVIGILASRIKDKYHRPTIVFADAGDGHIKGSARSIQGFHIRDALDAIASRYPEVLQKFGGHAMAAGLSIAREKFEVFSQLFDQEVRRQLKLEDLSAIMMSDGELQTQDFNLAIAQQLRDAGPWGQHFPEPLFDGEFYVVQQKLLAEKHLKMTLSTEAQGQLLLDAIAFNVDTTLWPNPNVKKIKLAYKLDVNEYRGNKTLQLMVDYIEAVF